MLRISAICSGVFGRLGVKLLYISNKSLSHWKYRRASVVPVLTLKVRAHRLTLVVRFNVNKRSALVPEAKQLQFLKLVSLTVSAAFHTAAHPVRLHLT